MKRITFTWVFILVFFLCFSQENKSTNYTINTIAFYNLENFFDTIDDLSYKDEYSPILQLKSGKSDVYWQKVKNMAKVLSGIGKEKSKVSPTIIGLAEIENSAIIEDILNTPYFKNKGYNYIHEDSPDWRGIDVAVLFKESVFSPSNFKTYQLNAWNEDGYKVKTRNQLLVSGYLGGELITLIINHWPSQQSGKDKTNYLRKKSALLTKSIIKSVYEKEPNAKIIIMGDFNDNPNEQNFKSILNTSSEKNSNIDNLLYNPYENMFKKGMGTLGFRDALNLFDQIIITSNFLENDYSSYQFYKAGIFNPNYLITKSGRYKGYPFRSFSNNKFTGGYSDHYPVYIYVIKEK